MPLLQLLPAFFPWLFHSTEFWAAIIGVVGAFIGAIMGGRIAGRFALRAQEQAAKDQRQYALEIERRAIEHLQAIRAELTVRKTRNLDSLQRTLKDRAENRVENNKSQFCTDTTASDDSY